MSVWRIFARLMETWLTSARNLAYEPIMYVRRRRWYEIWLNDCIDTVRHRFRVWPGVRSGPLIVLESCWIFHFLLFAGVTMREKRGGAMSKMQKLRKRLSLSFGRLCEYQTNWLYNDYICTKYFETIACLKTTSTKSLQTGDCLVMKIRLSLDK